MRTSCNGCRILRKGCNDDCVIRPCLNWMMSNEAQSNATLFLAKFYGRAGLLNLLNAGAEHLRPAIFQSLLYEACGRVVDPIYGSVGLLYSGQWRHCQLAVDAVLKGLPIMQLSPPSLTISSDGPPLPPQQVIHLPPLKLYDIRHMSSSKDSTTVPATFVVPTGPRLKRRPRGSRAAPAFQADQLSINGGNGNDAGGDVQSFERLSMFSGESTEGSVSGQMGADSEALVGSNSYNLLDENDRSSLITLRRDKISTAQVSFLFWK
uniref:LOB domain-containing protein n=1 Tax=Chenopodium quinoa TaxID=63459 RepID=A0A803KV07_CHEQI